MYMSTTVIKLEFMIDRSQQVDGEKISDSWNIRWIAVGVARGHVGLDKGQVKIQLGPDTCQTKHNLFIKWVNPDFFYSKGNPTRPA